MKNNDFIISWQISADGVIFGKGRNGRIYFWYPPEAKWLLYYTENTDL
jgi:hypothetical protein